MKRRQRGQVRKRGRVAKNNWNNREWRKTVGKRARRRLGKLLARGL